MPDAANQAPQSTYLYFTGGGSDKEYHAHLREQAGGWVVDYANGPRGRVGQSKAKTPNPLPYDAAKKVFDDLVKSKQKGGYTEAESGVRFTNTENARSASGHEQQLCVSVDASRLEELIADPRWVAQQKANGERRSVSVSGHVVRGINKLGLYVNIPETWVAAFRGRGDFLMDGEQVGNEYHAFDLVEINGHSLRGEPFEHRYACLAHMLDANDMRAASIFLLKAASGVDAKRKLLQRMESQRHEGVVFKHLDAPYQAGRDNNSLKYKFNESVSCLVLAHNQKRSVQIGLLDGNGAMVPVGNVTIPAGAAIPEVNAVVEVEFLYYNPGGAFEQPVYLGERNDILAHEATLAQVTRYKPGAEGSVVADGVEAGDDESDSAEAAQAPAP